MAWSIADDYKCIDSPEKVVLTHRSRTADRHLDISHAFRGGLTRKEQEASMGAYVRLETAYSVPLALAGDYEWKPGDIITDSRGNRLNVFSAKRSIGWWRFIVFDPVLSHQLYDTLDVIDLAKDKDAAGAAKIGSEEILYAEVPCKLQWQSGKPGIHAGRAGTIHTAIVYLQERLYLTHGSQIVIREQVLGEGESVYRRKHPKYEARTVEAVKLWRFDLIDWTNPDRLDQLMQLKVQAVP